MLAFEAAPSRVDSQVPLALDAMSEPDVAVVPRDPALNVLREPELAAEAPHGWRYRSVTTLRPPATIAPLVSCL